MEELSLDRLGLGDLDEANALLQRSFAVSISFRARLARYLTLWPSSWLALRGSQGLVGMVGANLFPGCAYIGLMAVAPEAQRRGQGERLMRTLLAALEEEGYHHAVLDASDMGAPLYRKLGFVESGYSVQWDRPAAGASTLSTSATTDLPEGARAAPAGLSGESTLEEIAALDASLFGHDRRALWGRLAEEYPTGLFTTRDRRGLTGYLCLQPGLLGPWGAVDPSAAATLLRRVSAEPELDAGARVLAPIANSAAAQLLEASGFRETRRLLHMRRSSGPLPPELASAAGWPSLYGKASFCLG